MYRAVTMFEISPKEFALLEFLMRYPGQAFSKTQIIEHIWDFEYEGRIQQRSTTHPDQALSYWIHTI
ncbi:MAG: winged helix-turn-helix domain-containing protein [Acidimicrobiales bacterium]